jgi:thiol-disulfide isomerase/thioredoxin
MRLTTSKSGRVLAAAWLGLLLASHATADDPMVHMKIARVHPAAAAAPFALPSLDGRMVQSKDLVGKVVLINFWATWCGPCKDEMPAFERLRQQLDPDRFVVLTVTTDLQPEGITHFLQNVGVHLPVLFDEHQEVSRAYMVRALPTTVLVDPRGTLVGRAVGPREWDGAQAVRLFRMLAETSP